MATTPATQTTPSAAELWVVIKKEITGIQLLWEMVDGLYFQQQGKEWQALGNDTPLLIHWTQTALMESLLMRVFRLLDQPKTLGHTNLSLKQLVIADASIASDELAIRTIWERSGLKDVRNTYLSHNGLHRAFTEEHTLNIPLEPADIEALRLLVEGLRKLRRNVNPKLGAGPYVDQIEDLKIQNEIEILGRVLAGGNQFFKELPDRLLEAGC